MTLDAYLPLSNVLSLADIAIGETPTTVPAAAALTLQGMWIVTAYFASVAVGMFFLTRLMGVWSWRGGSADAPPTVLWALLIALIILYLGAAQIVVTIMNVQGQATVQQEVAASAVCNLMVLVVLAAMMFSRLRGPLGLDLPRLPSGVLIGMGAYLFVLPVLMSVGMLNQIIFRLMDRLPEPHPFLEELQQRPDLAVLIAISAVLLAPLAEEFIFRGLLQPGTRGLIARVLNPRLAGVLAVLITSVLFTWIHPPDIRLPIFALALVLGALRERRGSLWPCIVLHMIFNGVSITLTLMLPDVLK